MIFVAVLLILGISALIYTMTSTTAVSIANRQAEHDAKTLAEVKEALIGWSAARTPTASNTNARPGELPCPDTDNNGYAENDDNNDGVDEAGCAAGTVGRVPWKTLRIPEPKDSAGETLWYAISGNYRVYRSSTPHVYTSPITSDTRGTLTVHQESTSNTITDQAVAVLFAPGAALENQDRSTTTTMSCSAPSGTYFRYQCASNYLETTGGINNAAIDGPYVQAPSTSTFNDRVLVISAQDLMPPVEQRVAREMMSILERYRIARGVYPWADLADGASNASGGFYYNRNRFPCGTALPSSWAGAGITLPNWLTNGCGACVATDTATNPSWGWACVVFYAVAKYRLEDDGDNCSTCANSTTACGSTTTSISRLTVANTSGNTADLCTTGASPFVCTPSVLGTGTADLVLMTPGAATASRSTMTNWPVGFTTISNYFDDSANANNNDYNCYVVPTSTNSNRDRIYVVR